MKNLGNLISAAGAIVMALTIIALCYMIHWAFGSVVLGIVLMIAGAIVGSESKN